MKTKFIFIFLAFFVVNSTNAQQSESISDSAKIFIGLKKQIKEIKANAILFSSFSTRIVNEENRGYIDEGKRTYSIVLFRENSKEVCEMSVFSHWDRGYDFLLRYNLKQDTITTVFIQETIEEEAILRNSFEKKFNWPNSPISFTSDGHEIVACSTIYREYLWKAFNEDLSECLRKK